MNKLNEEVLKHLMLNLQILEGKFEKIDQKS